MKPTRCLVTFGLLSIAALSLCLFFAHPGFLSSAPQVTIAIAYGGEGPLVPLIHSLRQSSLDLDVQVYLAHGFDNDAVHNTISEIPGVTGFGVPLSSTVGEILELAAVRSKRDYVVVVQPHVHLTAEWVKAATDLLRDKTTGLVGCQVGQDNGQLRPSFTLTVNLTLTRADSHSALVPSALCFAMRRTTARTAVSAMPQMISTVEIARAAAVEGSIVPSDANGLRQLLLTRLLAITDLATSILTQVELSDLSTEEYRQIISDSTNVVIAARVQLRDFSSPQPSNVRSAFQQNALRLIDKVPNHRMVRLRAVAEILTELSKIVRAEVYEAEEVMTVLTLALYYTTSTRAVVLQYPILHCHGVLFAAQFEIASQHNKQFRGPSLAAVAPYFRAASVIMSTTATVSSALVRAGSRIPKTIFFVACESAAPDVLRELRVQTAQNHLTWMRAQTPEFEVKVLHDAECADLASLYRRTTALFQALSLRPAREHICRLLYILKHGGYFVAPGAVSPNAKASDWTHSPSPIFTARSLSGQLLPPSLAFGAMPNNPCVKRVLNSAVDVYSRHLSRTASDDKLRAVLNGDLDADVVARCLASIGGTAMELPSHSIRWPAEVVRTLWESDFVASTRVPIPPRVITVTWVDQVPPEITANRSSWASELGESWTFSFFTRIQCEAVARTRNVMKLWESMTTAGTVASSEANLICAALACSLDGGLVAHWSVSIDDTVDVDVHPGSADLVVTVDGAGVPTEDILGCRAEHPQVLNALRNADTALTLNATVSFAHELAKQLTDRQGVLVIPAQSSKLVRAIQRQTSALSNIPRRVLTTVHSSLSRAAEAYAAAWFRGQRGFALHVLNDRDCEHLANKRRERQQGIPRWNSFNQATQRAEYCRMLALYEYGGVYIDSDAFVLAPLEELINGAQGSAVLFTSGKGAAEFQEEQHRRFVTWIVAAAPGHPVIEKVLESYDALAAPGPFAFARVITPSVLTSVTVIDLADAVVAYHAMASSNWVQHTEYHSPETQRLHDSFLQRWGKRIVYIPLSRNRRSPLLRNEIERLDVDGLPQLIFSEGDCLHNTWNYSNIQNVIANWGVLPYTLKNLFCASFRLAESSEMVWAMSIDARLRVTGHVGLAFSSNQASSVVLPEAGGGFSTAVMGLTKLCAKDLVNAIESRVLEASQQYADLTKKMHPGVFFASPQGQSLLGIAPRDFESLLRSLDSCGSTLHTLDRNAFWSNMAMMAIGDVSNGVIPSVRHIVIPHAAPAFDVQEYTARFQYDNPEIYTQYHSIAECAEDGAAVWKEAEIQSSFTSLPFESARLLCELFYIERDGGIITRSNVLSYLPLSLWFNAGSTFVSASDHSGQRSSVFWAAKPHYTCIANALTVALGQVLRSIEALPLLDLVSDFQSIFAGCPPPKIEAELVYSVGIDVAPNPQTPVASQQIPRRAYTTWKTHELFDDAALLDRQWRVEEPTIERRVVNDSECRYLAARYTGLLETFDQFPINVMRADTCRYLAIYYYGGIYMDLDVAWARRVDEWFDWSADFIAGNETEGNVVHVCNWFFAAKPKHPCLEGALDLIKHRWRILKDHIDKTPHFVHRITGPAMFTDAIKSCGVMPRLTRDDVGRNKIYHQYGSQVWKNNPKYESWTDRRDRFGARRQN